MKFSFALALFVTIAITAVLGQPQCTTNKECHQHGLLHCGHHTHVVCHGNFCECTSGPTDQSCLTEADCASCGNHEHGHCVNNLCHCAH